MIMKESYKETVTKTDGTQITQRAIVMDVAGGDMWDRSDFLSVSVWIGMRMLADLANSKSLLPVNI